MTYQTTLPKVPDDVDPVEWFLFDNKAGFCNYFASSDVLMLRSLGIPARLAAGYAQGEWNKDTGAYTVLSGDYHAWPEVFFPGIGWIPFEPTAAQPALQYPEGAVNTSVAPGRSAPPNLYSKQRHGW